MASKNNFQLYKELTNYCKNNSNLVSIHDEVSTHLFKEMEKYSDFYPFLQTFLTKNRTYDIYTAKNNHIAKWVSQQNSEKYGPLKVDNISIVTHPISCEIKINHDALLENKSIEPFFEEKIIPALTELEDKNLLYGDGDRKYLGILKDPSKVRTFTLSELIMDLSAMESNFPKKYLKGACWILAPKILEKLKIDTQLNPFEGKLYTYLGIPIIRSDLLKDGHLALLINWKKTMNIVKSTNIKLSHAEVHNMYSNLKIIYRTGNNIKNFDSCFLLKS